MPIFVGKILDMSLSLAVNYIHHFTNPSAEVSDYVEYLRKRVIYNYTKRDYVAPIETLRRSLKHDARELQITDLGAGSSINNSKVKKVSTLAKDALKPPRIAALIARLAADISPALIVELGTCLGITTLYLAKAVPQAKVITIEGCPQTAAIARENFDKANARNIEIRVGDFNDQFPALLEEMDDIGLIFIDGNHRKEATLNYFHLGLTKIHAGSVMIFDDIYWSEGMKEAWDEIKSHSEVAFTIDLFYIGLVFFNKEERKSDYRLRYI